MTEQTPSAPRAAADWLELRADADARARAASLGLIERLNAHIVGEDGNANSTLKVYDLGAGAGANLRWLAPRLRSHQSWTLLDLDAELLNAAGRTPVPHGEITRIDVATRVAPLENIGAVMAEDRHTEAASLVTCSAVLDVLSARQIESVVAAAAQVRAPVLASLSVTGDVELTPHLQNDDAIAHAFNAHQRRDGRAGPDAVKVAAVALHRHGYTVFYAVTPWQLGAADDALIARYLVERADAACQQHPELRTMRDAWLAARARHRAAEQLNVRVDHVDLLGLP